MSTLIVVMIAVLVVWMLACAWCGFRKRFGLFAVALLGGLALNMASMMIGLDARFLEPNALMAQGAVTLYGICAFGFGWLVGRVARAWQSSSVKEIEA